MTVIDARLATAANVPAPLGITSPTRGSTLAGGTTYGGLLWKPVAFLVGALWLTWVAIVLWVVVTLRLDALVMGSELTETLLSAATLM